MCTEDCHDRFRFRLSDDSGVLRFMEIEIRNAPTCRDVERTLREYLVGRALGDVDLEYLRKLACTGDGECMQAVIRELQKCQHLFVRNREGQTTTC